MSTTVSTTGEHVVRAGADLGQPQWHEAGEPRAASLLNQWIEAIAPCPWQAHTGMNESAIFDRKIARPLYTPEERARRDTSSWTLVQAILAPIQFLAFAVSLALVLRYLWTGQGYELATASIIVKTALLYAIMITGSIWENEVFGKWLFARAFFWEDMFSMIVLGLQTAYLVALVFSWGSPRQQMLIAIAAYATYVINATQFLLKLRTARLEETRQAQRRSHPLGTPA